MATLIEVSGERRGQRVSHSADCGVASGERVACGKQERDEAATPPVEQPVDEVRVAVLSKAGASRAIAPRVLALVERAVLAPPSQRRFSSADR